MSDGFLDDRPRRISVASQVTTSENRVFLIHSPNFFAQRGKKMEPLPEFSDKVFEDLVSQDKGDTYIVLLDTRKLTEVETIVKELKKRCSSNVDLRIFEMNMLQIGDTISRLKNLLQGIGLRFTPIRNPRTVSPLNIYKFVQGDRMVVVKDDDYAKFGIEPDKELTFQDMVKRRKQSAWL